MRSATHIPRPDRDLARGRRAADAVKAAGGSALDCWNANLDARFGSASVHNRVKRNVDLVLRKGPNSIEARFYRRLALLLQDADLDEAIRRMSAYQSARQRIARIAHVPNVPGLEQIRSAMIMLRLLRFRRMPDAEFRQLVDRVCGLSGPMRVAAE